MTEKSQVPGVLKADDWYSGILLKSTLTTFEVRSIIDREGTMTTALMKL